MSLSFMYYRQMFFWRQFWILFWMAHFGGHNVAPDYKIFTGDKFLCEMTCRKDKRNEPTTS